MSQHTPLISDQDYINRLLGLNPEIVPPHLERLIVAAPEMCQELREARAAFATILNNSEEPHIRAFAKEWFDRLGVLLAQIDRGSGMSQHTPFKPECPHANALWARCPACQEKETPYA